MNTHYPTKGSSKLNDMRFYTKLEPRDYEERVIKFFAWQPVKIGFETRWLEKVKVKQFYKYGRWNNHQFEN